MANKYAQTSGNWNGSIWYDAPSGGSLVDPPGSGDVAFLLAGVAVTLNVDVACDEIKAHNGTGWTTGTLVVPTGTTRTITCPAIRPGTETMMTLGSGGGTLQINGTLYGSNGSSKYGVNITGTGWTVQAPDGGQFHCVGSSNSSAGAEALLISAAATVTLTSATGGSASGRVGVRNSASGATLSVGTATGGSGAWSYAVQCGGGSTTIGTAIGGSAAGACCIYINSSAATVTIGTARGGVHANAGVIYPGIGGAIKINAIDPSGVGPIIGGALIRLHKGVRLPLFDENGSPVEFIREGEARRGLIGALR